MLISDADRIASSLDGVTARPSAGRTHWRYRGRLVARQPDETHVAMRADFDVRDALVRRFPETSSVPRRYVKHMMVVADLAAGDPDSVEDELVSTWRMQSGG